MTHHPSICPIIQTRAANLALGKAYGILHTYFVVFLIRDFNQSYDTQQLQLRTAKLVTLKYFRTLFFPFTIRYCAVQIPNIIFYGPANIRFPQLQFLTAHIPPANLLNMIYAPFWAVLCEGVYSMRTIGVCIEWGILL